MPVQKGDEATQWTVGGVLHEVRAQFVRGALVLALIGVAGYALDTRQDLTDQTTAHEAEKLRAFEEGVALGRLQSSDERQWVLLMEHTRMFETLNTVVGIKPPKQETEGE